MKNLRHLCFPGALILAFALAIESAGADLNIPPPADVLPKIHRTVPLVFPVRMLREGVKHGKARVLLNINSEGALEDSLVVGYTHAAFAEVATNTVKQWRFEAARSRGEPVGAVVDLNVIFEATGVIAVEKPVTPGIGDPQADDDVYQPYPLKALDGTPLLLRDHQVKPAYPQELIAKGVTEKITVDFYIDENGMPRMPTIASGNNPYLRASSLTAIRQWRFEPPTYHGKPVLARVQQIFDFSPPEK